MIKKIILLLMASMILSSCSYSIQINTDPTLITSSDVQIKATKETVSVVKEVVLETDNLKISTEEYGKIAFGEGVTLVIENKMKEDITIVTTSGFVNDYELGVSLTANVSAGKKTKAQLYIPIEILATLGIDHVSDISVNFSVFDSNTRLLFETSDVKIKTSEYNNRQEVDLSQYTSKLNTEEYELAWKVFENINFGPYILIHLVNKTNESYTFSCDSVELDGYEFPAYSSIHVEKAANAILGIPLSTIMSMNKITTLNHVVAYVKLISNQTNSEIFSEELEIKK